MASFQVRGLTAQGQLQERSVQASDPQEASRLARQAGLEVLAVSAPGLRATFGPRSPRFDLALFAQELQALLRAGLTLVESLEALAERQQATGQGDVLLAELVARMQEGLPFSQALRAYPGTFPELFVASIAASEQTGEMQEALTRYLRYHEQVRMLRQRIVSASLYPAVLLLVGSAVGLFLLCYLVPRFSLVYAGLEARLPLGSRLLLRWGQFAGEHTWLVTGMALGLFLALVMAVRVPAMQQRALALLQRQRVLGAQLRLMQLTRFYRSLGLLLDGGIPVLRALGMTRALLPLPRRLALERAIQGIGQGRSLSDCLQEQGLTTPVALRLIRAGERNGQVADMLEQVAAFHEKEVEHWLERFSKLVEPILMLLIGTLIGGIVILLYLPIFELAGNLQ